MSVDAQLDRLFEAPLEDFTRLRNELAAELKSDGRTEEAATIKAMKKPSLPVWALNQLARREPELIEKLLEVQRKIGGGSTPKSIQVLTRSRREIAGALTKAARGILDEQGHAAGASTIEKITNTLFATNTPEEIEALRAGRLSTELSSTSLEEAFAAMPGAPAEDEAGPSHAVARASAQLQELEEQSRAAEEETTSLRRKAEQLKVQAEEAERAAATSERQTEKLRVKVEAARERVSELGSD
jgi:hypothetical protein